MAVTSALLLRVWNQFATALNAAAVSTGGSGWQASSSNSFMVVAVYANQLDTDQDYMGIGGRYSQPGLLKGSIYQVYSKSNSGADHATYHISWNHHIAPHGHLVENGTSRAPAHPFIRPAFTARSKDALEASNQKYTELMQQTIGALK